MGSTSATNTNFYSGVTSVPTGTDFGSGAFTAATTGSGDFISVNGSFFSIFNTYVSGNALTSNNVYASTTISALGLNQGSFTWAWSTDSVVVNVIPEPSTAFLFLGFMGAALTFSRRR